jgi:hypothetical protein
LDERLQESVTLFQYLERLFSKSNQETSGSIPNLSEVTLEFFGSEKPALAISDTEKKIVIRKGGITEIKLSVLKLGMIPQSARGSTLRMQTSPKLGKKRSSSARIMESD